jgi:hypothetical protein
MPWPVVYLLEDNSGITQPWAGTSSTRGMKTTINPEAGVMLLSKLKKV